MSLQRSSNVLNGSDKRKIPRGSDKMKIWILSADGKNLILASRFSVTKNIGGKKEQKWAVTAYTDAEGIDGGAIAAGYYPDEKLAQDELRKIAGAIKEGSQFYKFEETEYNRYAE